MKKACGAEGCPRPYRARGYCVYHYSVARKDGSLELRWASDAERIFSHVVPTGFCWLWTSTTNAGGYGTTKSKGKSVLAHRWIYEHLVGPIAEGLELDHLCRIRQCVNPDHLEPVSQEENQRRGLLGKLRREVCHQGHPFTEENTFYENQKGRVARRCRECHNARQRRYKERKALAAK